MALTKAQCRQIFDKFAGPDGLLTPHELKTAINSLSAGSCNLTNNELDQLVVECFQGMDIDGDHKISLDEFINDMTKPARAKKLEETFKQWDKDGSGYLSTAELKVALMETMDEETAKEICDQINDDHITLEQFMILCN
ncbi:hypothetical protein CHS0354_031523 [Potamilus streckersoni]|uniref:EF-hand domain-containing protein n=1 Tax=Potamilus streckersoni TaxID=2493646 RepID=A0AAE0SHH1_9BIVA|nr:hypothetical protein CHS0354_031523 [Potamilus streckersoni]